MLPRFEIVGRRRPVDLVAASDTWVDQSWVERAPRESSYPTPLRAPYAAVEATLSGEPDGRLVLELTGGGVRLSCWYVGPRGDVGLEVAVGGRTTTHRSRRHSRAVEPAEALGLTLTGTHLTVLTREGGAWVARARVDLSGWLDTREEAWLASMSSAHRWEGPGAAPLSRIRAGGFGQLGLRDVRLVSHADGTAYRQDGAVLVTATSAGPGFFDTAHTSVWSLDPESLDLTHRADLFFRRPDRPGVFGDHATHLVRDGERWLVATSTWGDFDRRRPGASVSVTIAESHEDLLTGSHVLDTEALALPTAGLGSVGVWDPHLVRTAEGWLVGYVSARRFFRFHPVLATGPALDRLELRSAAADRLATEGTTLFRLDEGWRVLASDGRDGRRGQRGRFPVFDLDLNQIGALDATYPTNIPWPSLVREEHGWLMVTFNGSAYGGRLLGYGTHGEVVLMRAVGSGPDRRESPEQAERAPLH